MTEDRLVETLEGCAEVIASTCSSLLEGFREMFQTQGLGCIGERGV